MATYSIELRNVIQLFDRPTVEGWFKEWELSDFLTPEEIQVIEERGTWSKDKLATKIVDAYFMREIGFETPALFRHYAKITMREIMEEYAPLIYSASIAYDPLVNVDFTETTTGVTTGDSDSTSTSNGSGLTVSSDTPQGQISKSAILQGEYASSTSANETENSVVDKSKTSGTQDFVKKVRGNSGVSATAQAMVLQYRKNIRALDSEIIERLSTLFMGIY